MNRVSLAARDKQLVNARPALVPFAGPLEFNRALRQSSQLMNALTRTEIIRLTATERLTLIGDLWDSPDDAEEPVSPRAGGRA
jgi:hypothetical protein